MPTISSVYHPNPLKNSCVKNPVIVISSVVLVAAAAIPVLGHFNIVEFSLGGGITLGVMVSPAGLYLGYKSFKYISSIPIWNDYKGSSFQSSPADTSSPHARGLLAAEHMIRAATKVKSVTLGVNSHLFFLEREHVTSVKGKSATSVNCLTHSSGPARSSTIQIFEGVTLRLGPNSGLQLRKGRRTLCAFQNVISYSFAETGRHSFDTFATSDGHITQCNIPSLNVTLRDEGYIYDFREGQKYKLLDVVSCVHFLPTQTVIKTVSGDIFFEQEKLYQYNSASGVCKQNDFPLLFVREDVRKRDLTRAIRSIGSTVLIASGSDILVFDAASRTKINVFSTNCGPDIVDFQISRDAFIIAHSWGLNGSFELKKLVFH